MPDRRALLGDHTVDLAQEIQGGAKLLAGACVGGVETNRLAELSDRLAQLFLANKRAGWIAWRNLAIASSSLASPSSAMPESRRLCGRARLSWNQSPPRISAPMTEAAKASASLSRTEAGKDGTPGVVSL
jgi:hypothetical protein